MIDHISHVGDVLARTAGDVGSDVELFTEADVFLFCSALVSRQVMEDDLMNIAHCPYGIFVAGRDGAVTVGFRTKTAPSMQPVQDLLTAIVEEAVAN